MKLARGINPGYLPGIDGLRAIAVLSVILFHFNSSILPGGFSGVDVFFVISGYVVSSSLARENPTTFKKFLIDFYARRIVRIYPALIVCIILTGLAQTFLVPASWLSTTSTKTALYAYFGLSNFALIWFNDGYFSPQVEFNPFTHTWSLGVEEQFYLLFPIIFFVWLKGRVQKNIYGVFANALLPVLLLISLFFSWLETTAAPGNAFYLLPSRFWELACGAMLFRFHQQNTFLSNSNITANCSVIGGLVLVGLGLVFSNSKSFPFPWALLSVAGALFIIGGVASKYGKDSGVGSFLGNKVMVYIGKISYSLYLWHWPILVLFRWTVGLEEPRTIIGAVILIVILSNFSYHVVEKPTRKSNFVLLKPNGYIVSRGLGIIILGFIFSSMVFRAQPYLSLSATKDMQTWYPHPWPSSVPTQSTQKPFAGLNIFVIGDSHTGAYSTMLRKLEEEQGIKVRQYAKGGCAIANLLNPSSSECNQFIQQTLLKIKKESASGDIVFLASLRMVRLSDQWKTYTELDVLAEQSSSHQRSHALHEANNIITMLEKASLIVLLDAPKPIFKSPPFRCSDWFNVHNPICQSGFEIERSFLLKHRKPVMESINTLTRSHPNLVIWDPFPILCPSNMCSAFDKEKPLFFDGDHLSAHGNRVLYPSFISTLMSTVSKTP